jgi:flagellar FliL protein
VSRKVEIDLKFIIIALAFMIIASVGSAFTAYLMLAPERQAANAAKADQTAKDIGPTYQVGDFTVNLAETSSIRFIRTGLVLELEKEGDLKEAEKREPQIRDRVISVLRTRTLADLKAPDGLDKLRTDLIESINELFVSSTVTDIFFVDLVFQ